MRLPPGPVVALVLSLLAGCAARPAPHPPVATVAGESAVMAAEDSLYAALVARDSASLARYLADEFVLSGSAEALETREQYLTTAAMPGRTLDPVVLSGRMVRVFGTTAVSTGRGVLTGRMREQPFSLRFRYTNVFVSRAGRWQAVASHLSVIR